MVAYCSLYLFLTLCCMTIVYGEDCPRICACLGTYIDCSKKALTEIPSNLPNWVNELELSNNVLSGDIGKLLLQLTSLSELKLNKNSLKTIPHLYLPSLRKLFLSHNEIGVLDYGSLEGLPLLEDLDLSNNRFDKTDHISFPKPNILSILNLNNNRIKSLTNNSLQNLTSLTELKLNRNRISNLNREAFSNLHSLKVLELNRNQLREINGLVFQELSNLTALKLRRNHITEVKDGAFYGTKLLHLQLDYNSISTVHMAGFYGLSTLTSLSLSHNLIDHIENGVWKFCKNIQELDVSNNQISAIKKGTFEHLASLVKLHIHGNKIAFIEESAFSFTPNLLLLELSNNKISWTIEDQSGPFVGLDRLQHLNLGSNNIKSIGQNAFDGLESLIELDLTNNNITSVNENAFAALQSIQQLHMNTSSLLCDCNLHWLNIWLQKHQNVNGINIYCSYPFALRGESLLKLQAENFTCDDSPKPQIVEEPKSQMVLKGENVSLICKASSSTNAPMAFLWKRDNFDIKNTEVTNLERSPDGKISEAESKLRLYNVSHNDAGKYQCIVENTYGTTYSARSKIVVVTFPTFEKIPWNITVRPGSTARLECAATGQPMPQIAWQKDGGNDFPAARERRMHVMPTDDVFFITNAKIADMGVYSCTARNPAGVIVVNATLTIEETPSFVKPMENKEVTLGQTAVLECLASGSPKPLLRWSKDGEPIKLTERHFFAAGDQLLIITNSVMSDAGSYVCKMVNSVGTEQGQTNLRVNPVVAAPVVNYMMGVIIISVVCCAVGTSIGWVVIIYHIRKRLKTHQKVTECSPALMDVPSDEGTANIYTDAVSDHSSCKDSGTGDSAKRSSDELLPSDDYSIEIHDTSASNNPTLAHNSQHRHTNHKRLSTEVSLE